MNQDRLNAIEAAVYAIEMALCRSLSDVIAEQLAWSKGRDSANRSDIQAANDMLQRWNSKRAVPFLDYYEPVPTGVIEIEGDDENA